ncbi:hypothetical protein L2E82_26370 [Cichorium intybus]|uniref:Uncharacterized protein n=1 Tax=Cichorium intybus TaxID=13427 RepID=A0ACB9CQM5_CICIN|nr:hypothetical protein L2E82_26370 [Cichorium intybus]
MIHKPSSLLFCILTVVINRKSCSLLQENHCNVNEHSSRSHCMICITVKAKNLMNGECTKSKLWQEVRGWQKQRWNETASRKPKTLTNLFLHLGMSYMLWLQKALMNSKLTHLLHGSLGKSHVDEAERNQILSLKNLKTLHEPGGDSKTLMYVQISPSEQDMSETLSSLNFATRVRGVELGPARKQIDSSELQKLKSSLDKAKQDLKLKDEALKKLEESHLNLEVKIKCKDQMYKSQQDEVAGQLELKAHFYKQLEKKTSQLSDQVKEKETACLTLRRKVVEAEKKLKEITQMFQCELLTCKEKIKELEKRLERQDDDTGSQVQIQEQGRGVENTLTPSSSSCFVNEKVSGAFARVTRSSTKNIINKEQTQRPKERDDELKFWVACGFSADLKCKLPSEDLYVLVSVTCDEDLAAVVEEYDRVSPDAKIRAILCSGNSLKTISPVPSVESLVDFSASKPPPYPVVTNSAVWKGTQQCQAFDFSQYKLPHYPLAGSFHDNPPSSIPSICDLEFELAFVAEFWQENCSIETDTRALEARLLLHKFRNRQKVVNMIATTEHDNGLLFVNKYTALNTIKRTTDSLDSAVHALEKGITKILGSAADSLYGLQIVRFFDPSLLPFNNILTGFLSPIVISFVISMFKGIQSISVVLGFDDDGGVMCSEVIVVHHQQQET